MRQSLTRIIARKSRKGRVRIMDIMSLAGLIWGLILVIVGIIVAIVVVAVGITVIVAVVKICVQKVRETDLHG